MIIKANKEFEECNTNSSKSSVQKDLKPNEVRQRRKEERLKHKNEAILYKKKHFGDSSSDEQPVGPRPNFRII